MSWVGTWAGGPVRINRGREKVWVIQAMRGGPDNRYSITLDVHSEKAAMAELALFNRDPKGYAASHAGSGAAGGRQEGLVLDEALLAEFLDDVRTGDRQVGEAHAVDLERYLTWWMGALDGRLLKTVTLADYQALARKGGKTARRIRIACLRSLTHWLRRQGRLSTTEDTSVGLEIPQTKAKRAHKKVGYSMEEFEKVYFFVRGDRGEDEFAQAIRDVLVLRALCGIHHREVERIAAGERKVERLKGQGEIAGFVVFAHKKGMPHPQALGAKALAAVERLQKRGVAPVDQAVSAAVTRASKLCGVPRRTPGELRHSFITWALQHGREVKPQDGGVSLDAVRKAVGHTSIDTTFIYNSAVPALIVLPMDLQNPEDPDWVEETAPVEKKATLRIVGGS